MDVRKLHFPMCARLNDQNLSSLEANEVGRSDISCYTSPALY